MYYIEIERENVTAKQLINFKNEFQYQEMILKDKIIIRFSDKESMETASDYMYANDISHSTIVRYDC